ncbi:TIGR03546 family protein [Desulfoluna sp.]|uniref:TIGR03546 family protein n=1 Tax=Desulfoluna sp. TaxID=2045199 RepID=UPI002630501A|nr:TIGR03546 family protein [Desulfoluna sp.]
MIQLVANLLKLLNSEAEPAQISLALCLAMVLGFTPLFSLHNLIILFIICVVRVNLSACLLGWAIFSGIAWLIDPLFHGLGHWILTLPSLEGLWTSLYNLSLFRLARFNNTVVMGSLLTALVLFVPLFLVTNRLIAGYRTHLLAWVDKSRLMKIFKASKIYDVYKALA